MAVEKSGLAFKPMDQFVVKPLFGGDHVGMFTVTNVTFWMALAVVAVVAMMVLGTRRRAIVPSRGQSIAELAYGFVYKMVEDVAGKDGLKYFPYIFTLFMFILFANLIGMVPYFGFTFTSHIAVTFAMAFFVFVGDGHRRQDHAFLVTQSNVFTDLQPISEIC